MKINSINITLLKLISALSGYMHDFGKANNLFQSKIRGESEMSDIIRHEFLSFYIILNLIEQYEFEVEFNHNTKFITQEKWKAIFNKLSQTYDKEYLFFFQNLNCLLKQDHNDYYSFKIHEKTNPITLCVLFCVLTHHKLPLSSDDYDIEKMKASIDSLKYSNLNHTDKLEIINKKDSKERLQKNIELYKNNYYIHHDIEAKINDGFSDVYNQYQSLKNYSAIDKSLFFKSFSIISRIFLMMSDHYVSSIQKRALTIDKNNQDVYSLTYANTNRDFNNKSILPTFNQTLDEHLLDVGNQTKVFLDDLLKMEENLPSLSHSTVQNIIKKTNHKDFQWQDKAGDFIHNYSQTQEPTLILNMGTTGSGKTRMNVKALGALRNNKLRFTSVFNLKSLTLQTGEAYINQLKLNENECSILIGDKNFLDIQTNQNIEEAKLDNDQPQTESEYLMDTKFDSTKDWIKRPDFIKDKIKNGYKIDDFIGVPVLVSTIDFCINAGDLSKGSNHHNAFLRVMTSDLIIDEIDSYEPSMLESVLRLISISAMNQRNIVISSATLSKHYITMIKKAFIHGIQLGNMLHNKQHNGNIICISNLVDPKKINHEHDINNYIENLCVEFVKNTQKLAKILPIPENVKRGSIPSIFKEAVKPLHINNHQKIDDKTFSFGLIRVGQIKNAVLFSRKYLNTNFKDEKYWINNEPTEIKFLTYHSNLLNSKRFIVEEFLDKTLNQSTHAITNPYILDMVKKSECKHIIFIIIATPVEEIGRDHDFHWAIIEPSSIQSIIQTAGRVNRHRKFDVSEPNIYILQYNLSYYQGKQTLYFTRPGLEIEENLYEHDITKLLPWNDKQCLYITSQLRYSSLFANFDDRSIFLSLKELNYQFAEKDNYWFKMEYYSLNKLRTQDGESFTYIVNSESNTFYQPSTTNNGVGNIENIEQLNNKHDNYLKLEDTSYKQIVNNHPRLKDWSMQSSVNIYNDKKKSQLRYHHFWGFYFEE